MTVVEKNAGEPHRHPACTHNSDVCHVGLLNSDNKECGCEFHGRIERKPRRVKCGSGMRAELRPQHAHEEFRGAIEDGRLLHEIGGGGDVTVDPAQPRKTIPPA